MKQHDPIRIGRIQYTNAWPIFYHLQQETSGERIELISKVPSELNHSLSEGLLDVSAISSFAYGLNDERYVLLPDLSVSSNGKVGSIFLFMKKSLNEVRNGSIAFTTASATSVNLLRIIMEKFLGGKPRYITAAPDLESMLKEADAALLIGDDAIRAAWSEHPYEVMDLGQAWKEHTGLGMTFAVWAVRRAYAEDRPETVRAIYEAFQRSKQRSMADLGPVTKEACLRIGGTENFWNRYFSGLNYDFGQSQWNGLQLYFEYAKELGLIQRTIPLRIWSNNTVVQVNS
ncbi:ABC transporter substrate-binding protein [Paenibacillus swuensis]|uniref:Chorismate dehydratase n=1 Tax=Paenibacillus swuensis TaxID=1178515 RepID=A0A172TLW4_9BACL|nr:menaquinone biosynthesis protein [Paenibacillus swuensis]ANE47972.1 ABC transporter substrate-binding protein [Paenibacillus swuensis]